jgi:hypothetical protein
MSNPLIKWKEYALKSLKDLCDALYLEFSKNYREHTELYNLVEDSGTTTRIINTVSGGGSNNIDFGTSTITDSGGSVSFSRSLPNIPTVLWVWVVAGDGTKSFPTTGVITKSYFQITETFAGTVNYIAFY